MQGGLTLPDRDYYFDKDKKEKRDAYLVYMTQLFNFLGESGMCPQYADPSTNAKIAQGVLAFETTLASSHLTRSEARDPEKTYNKMSVATLATRTANPAMTW